MKPQLASEYTDAQLEQVKSTCLHVATRLSDFLDDIVVVGGLVPSLLIPRDDLPRGVEAHVGTLDLDLGFELGILDQQHYSNIAERLRNAGFSPDENEAGNPTRQRWVDHDSPGVTVDFLIPPSKPDDRGGDIRDLEQDFAAVITPGLMLAFSDRKFITLDGTTTKGDKCRRDIPVCGPGAYVVLKALAFRNRAEPKDAYDLYYVVAHFRGGPQSVATHLKSLGDGHEVRSATEILRSDFTDHDGIGPRSTARFLSGDVDDEVQADVTGSISRLLEFL